MEEGCLPCAEEERERGISLSSLVNVDGGTVPPSHAHKEFVEKQQHEQSERVLCVRIVQVGYTVT